MRRDKEVYYWKGKGEIDFIVKEGLKIRELLQVCYGLPNEKIKSREIKGLSEAANEFDAKSGKIITEDYYGKEKIGNLEVEFIPLWLWLLEDIVI